MVDLYVALGVCKDASQDEIKRKFRKLTLQHHPDRNPGDAEAEARFKEVTQAYEVLGDATKRKKYDRLAPGLAPGLDFEGTLVDFQSLFTSYTAKLERIRNLTIPKDIEKQREKQVATAKKLADGWIAEAEKKSAALRKAATRTETAQRKETDDWVALHIRNAKRRIKEGETSLPMRSVEAEAGRYRREQERITQRQLREQQRNANRVLREATRRARDHVATHRRLARERAYEETERQLTSQERTELERRVSVAVEKARKRQEVTSDWVEAIKTWRSENQWYLLVVFAGAFVAPWIPYIGAPLLLFLLCFLFFVIFPRLFFWMYNMARVGFGALKRRKRLVEESSSK